MMIPNTLILCFLVLHAGTPVSRCALNGPPTGKFGPTDVVFVGKVIEIVFLDADSKLPTGVVNLERPIRAKFSIERSYHGIKGNEAVVETISGGGMEWGADFGVGNTYLVYANTKSEKDKSLTVRSCGRTRLASEAAE